MVVLGVSDGKISHKIVKNRPYWDLLRCDSMGFAPVIHKTVDKVDNLSIRFR